MRAWIAVAICGVFSPAYADRLDPCARTPFAVFPHDGATNVPINTDLWIVGDKPHLYELRVGTGKRLLGITSSWSRPSIMRIDLGVLHRRTTYTIARDGERMITFTTGSYPDMTSPTPPIVGDARVDNGRFVVAANFATDSPATWVTVRRWGERDPRAWQLFPSGGLDAAVQACSQIPVPRASGVCVDLRSFDAASNLSTIASRCIALPGFPSRSTQSRDYIRIALLIAIGFAAGVVLAVQQRWRERRRLRATSTRPITSIRVQSLARLLRMSHAAYAVAFAAAFAILVVASDTMFDDWLPLVMPIITIAIAAGISVWCAHRVMVLLSRSAASKPTTDGQRLVLVVERSRLRSFLELGVTRLRGRSRSLPRATAKRVK
jgi:hypothetical protein